MEELQKAEAAPPPPVREGQMHSSHGLVHRWLRPLELVVHNGARCMEPRGCTTLGEAGKSESTQHADLIAAVLAAGQSRRKNQKVIYIFTDSWAAANGTAI